MSIAGSIRASHLLAVAMSLALFASVFVVFVEPFRTDESWYIYRARLDIDIQGTVDATAAMLRGWFLLFDGLWPGLLLLRVVTLACYGLTVLASYAIFRMSGIFSGSRPAFVTAVAFASWLALNRGFEIRPEIWAHLFMLSALAVGLGWAGLRDRSFVAALAVLLFLPTVFSFRFWPVCLALFFTIVAIGSRSGAVRPMGFGRIAALTAAYFVIVLLVQIIALDLVSGMQSAASWRQSNDQQMDALEKLRFRIGAPVIFVFYAIWGVAIVLAAAAVGRAIRKSAPLLALVVLAPALAYYAFFFLVEVQPYRYTRALEAVVLLSSAAAAFKLRIAQMPASRSLQVLVAGALATATLLAAYKELGPRYHFVEAFFRHAVVPGRMPGALDRMHSPESLIEQITTRVDYCNKHPSQNVLINRPTGHPFCGVDVGSVYNTGFRRYPDDLRLSGTLQSRGPILVSIKLAGDLAMRGFACSANGVHYATCERPQAKKESGSR